ncbi:hypothetical protein [Paenibacillus etheri]|uniref:Cache domain-containing protein n=1 Tax=Paenibacillus etheri TaxID=1306852 RepID=A0A0W1ATP7_9BACL|nr:hypothetical protein [Paenibacillus etheri]KTD84721.1 hypothetical protein UQ64_24050 [Paenibacillus etheri]
MQTRSYGSHKPDYYELCSRKTDGNDITIAANIKDSYDPSDPTLYGFAIFDYNISKLKRIYDQIQTQTGIDSIIVDDQQQFIYQTDSSLTLTNSSMENLFEHSSGYWTEDIECNKSLMLIRNTTIKSMNLLRNP